jgi:sulfite reductase alpha subunit-like flavoprotein
MQLYLSLEGRVWSVSPIDEEFSLVSGNLYVLLVSTTGQGDPPHSIRSFWKQIMSKNYQSLEGTKFCVYGLGDRSYGDNFNMSARKLRQRLLMLKAQEVVEIGLGDEQEPQGCFQQYFQRFLPGLLEYLSGSSVKKPQNNVDFVQMKVKQSSISTQNCM